MNDDLIHILGREANVFGISLGAKQKQLFAVYYDEFQVWNEKINLTSIANGISFVSKHFIDSLLPLAMIPREAKKILDLGTGGGLPGIPLKIARPDLEVVLLDASRKKTSFLKHVIAKLGLSGIQAVTGRAEDFCHKDRWAETYDVVISRAAFKLGYFMEIGSPFLRTDGLLIAMKGHDLAFTEEEEGRAAAEKYGMRHIETYKTTLPCFAETTLEPSWGTKGQSNHEVASRRDAHTTAMTNNDVFSGALENGRSIIAYKKTACFS
ncbi:MAG: 16S rRNA (guanine(527)-N(7))-methyltransferase RsmG [Syntrophobacterales bacterium]|jgi:16S rRNA (guanine527-N7)-methyltransferase|nr:16S rRNA (guanine(527)-N(7))-methyltransferase RsmG [Syntrophobacterales bacterium]